MTLAQISYFVKVAELGHLTQAAGEFMIAQPSLTQAIRKLEEEMGFPLFEKAGRRLILSREGSEFFPYAKRIVESHEMASRAAHHIYEENRGVIRFAHTEPMPKAYIPNLIFHFLEREENRGVRIESDVVGTAKVFRELRSDEIDFGFCSKGAGETDDLILYPLFRQPMVLIVARNDPLCSLKYVEPEDLVKRPCVSYGVNSVMYHQIQEFWKEQGLEPDVRYRSSAVGIGGMVARGLGWAFVALTDEIQNEDVAVIPMPKLKMERTMFLAMRADRRHGPTAERFLKFVLSYSKQFQ
ncbi:MAG: LysR family transcriptional regulator [Lachnospiraceae bacterium]|jgi:DNA-binding transcriptional LysR family regulator|nr:LysR family transcriptional regulator [Lachnospiraceae bacterium]